MRNFFDLRQIKNRAWEVVFLRPSRKKINSHDLRYAKILKNISKIYSFPDART